MKISIVIITFNRPEYLKKSLKSAVNQTFGDTEIIVIDNSTEDYYIKNKRIINSYKNIDHFWLGKNYGAQYARNFGIQKANGQYIAFLDDDDLWLPKKLERQIIVAEEYKAALVSCLSSHYLPYKRKTKKNIINTKPNVISFKSLIKHYNLGTTSTFFIKKSILNKVGGFDPTFPATQDHELGLRIAKKAKVIILPEILNIFQIPPNNHIGINFNKRIRGHLQLYKKYSKDYRLLGPKNAILQHIKFIIWIILLTLGLIMPKKTVHIIRLYQNKLSIKMV